MACGRGCELGGGMGDSLATYLEGDGSGGLGDSTPVHLSVAEALYDV